MENQSKISFSYTAKTVVLPFAVCMATLTAIGGGLINLLMGSHAANEPWFHCVSDVPCHGLFLPIINEQSWNIHLRAFIYFVKLLFFFLGTAILTQIFMASIDRITSHTKKIYLANMRAKKNSSEDSLNTILREDEPEVIEVRVWNDTVANLILMAFGTASPDILLSIVEVAAHHFESGKLGPATIVGAAAFNLLIITSVCMLALPPGEIKRVHRLKLLVDAQERYFFARPRPFGKTVLRVMFDKHRDGERILKGMDLSKTGHKRKENKFPVFVVTGLFSFFAYIWLLVILRFITPDVIELWEASITFILFPILIIFAYATDRDYFGFLKRGDTKRQIELGSLDNGIDSKEAAKKNILKENGQIDQENLLHFIKQAKKFPKLKDEEIAVLAATKLLDDTSHSSNWYRINSVRTFAGSRRARPVLDSKLKQIYDILKNHPEGLKLEDIPKDITEQDPEVSVIEFHSPTVSVKEDIGTFYVTICRYGNLESDTIVRIDSLDGTAQQGEDYHAVREVVTFKANESEKKIPVRIIDDNKWEPDEEFFLRLTIIAKPPANKARLGRFPIMEITIIDDDEPGILLFEKRGFVVKESAGSISIPVIRIRGADGDVSVKWKTVDKSAISGRDYVGGEGELIFKHNETKQDLTFTIIDDMNPEKDEYFEVVLYEPTNGAKIGNINRVLVTISNDDDFNSVTHRLMVMTGANLDALRVHTETWAEQFKLAMSVRGGDVENATFWDYVLHLFSFFWKVLFACIPPVAIFGGWLCFLVCLIMIGIMTTIIADLATIFGCLIGMDDTITAITIVALGTTLPDILGAKMVTCAETHADGALIHISGSIAVNVLMGVGLPWFVAALYHANKGSVFRIQSSGLEFSVLLFSILAVIVTVILILRRKLSYFGRAELGGPTNTRYLTVAVLVTMWILYILFNFLQISGVIRV